MKHFLRYLIGVLFLSTIGLGVKTVSAQSDSTNVFDPNDPVNVYDPANPPEQPPVGQVGKWVKTNRVSWNTSSFKCYIYKGIPFRLKYPKNYDSTKSYPLYLFFHGRGEYGSTIYDNEYQLALGGQAHMNAVDKGLMNGFLLYPQNQAGPWTATQEYTIDSLIENIMIPQLKVDPFRIYLNGLSAGGQAAWGFFFRFTKLVSAFTPISAASATFADSVKKYKFTPIWHFQGGLDNNPTPGSSRALGAQILLNGGNYQYTEFPDRGHDCWNQAWALAGYFPFYNAAYKSNPWPSGGRTEFCPGDAVVDTLGVTPGFDGYQWMKNGTVISGATSNTLVINDFGTYACRIKRGNVWSDWSPTPVVIKLKTATISPDIQVYGMASNVIPAPDGKTSVTLMVPANYVAYQWQKDGSTTTLGTLDTLTVSSPGNYKIKVTEKYGCSSSFSNLFPVINANGSNGPAAVSGLIGTPLSKTSVQLNWSQNANPLYNETAFEIYQANSASGPYKMVGKAAADSSDFTITDLTPGTQYFYIVRPVNNNAAAPATAPAAVTTLADVSAPTTPANLKVTFVSRNSVALQWDPSTDDVEVEKYDVYVNGVKTYVTESTSYTVYNLKQNTTYTFTVKARDGANNNSAFSNQVTATTIFTGLSYKYYEGSWSNLPNFTTLTPLKTGFTRNIDLSLKQVSDNFAFLWEGYIRIPVDGTYTFRTNSDDGSRLWLGTYNFSSTSLVNNDGAHGAQDADGTITLTAGIYPISIGYFEKTGSEVMTVSWKNPQTGGTFMKIPDSAFTEAPVVNGTAPAAPSNLVATTASYNKINLKWNDNSSDETYFEIARSTDRFNNFANIGRTAANVNTFTDTALAPSTTYYYRVRAINNYGQSEYDLAKGNGVDYAYYENNGSALTALPNFANLVPVKTGRVGNFALGAQARTQNFEFKFDGFINIPVAGNYTFSTISDAGSKLYINGYSETNLVVNNDGVHGRVEKTGTKNFAAAGLYPITVTYFNPARTASLNVYITGPGMTKQEIPVSLLGSPFANATTTALPGVPSAATNLVATAASPTSVNVTWTDNASNEDSYDVYRSANDNVSYVRIATVPANSTSYTDTTLFANSVFYYKVKVNNVGGSVFSNEDSAKTLDNIPVITHVTDRFMRYGTQLQIPVVATDSDPESLTFDFKGTLPAFSQFAISGNGQGLLTFNPQQSDRSSYQIKYEVRDQNGGSARDSFTLVVNDNYNPVVSPVSNITLNEKKTAQVNLSAADQNSGDVLSWSFSGLPSFATVDSTTQGVARISFAPGYADANVYKVRAYINDHSGGIDSTTFTVTVNDVPINHKYFINVNNTGNVAAPWNNLNFSPAIGVSRTGFKDSAGVASTVGLKVLSDWAPTGTGFNSGAITGNNSGVFIDGVMLTGWYTNTIKQSIALTGLDTALMYNVTFFASKANITDDRSTVYTINGTNVTLNPTNNTKNTVIIRGIKPNADSTILVDIKNAPISKYAYLNALVVESGYDDGTVPAAPFNTNAVFSQGKNVLTWKDAAYNESGYEIYRAQDGATAYTLLATQGANATSFNDSLGIAANHTYSYKIRAVNSYGASDSVSFNTVTIQNLAPSMGDFADQRIKTDQSVTLPVTATDDPADVLKLTVTNLPSFAAFTDNGNGTGSIVMNPAINDIGVYKNITVTAADNHGGSITKSFGITVTSSDLTSVYVNFNATMPTGAPWNNFTSAPTAGKALANVKDEFGNNSGITVTLQEAWSGYNTAGATTGNNSGIYPDSVMQTYYYEGTANTKHILLSGLSQSKKYNLSFLSSWNKAGTYITNYSVAGQTIALNAAMNTSKVAKFNGIAPDANGQIQISITKDATSSYATINAMVLQSFDTSVILAPTGVAATGMSKTLINLSWTDNSQETGFEIWRSSSANGAFSLIGTTAANVTTYSDNGLVENSNYYYKVRAIAGSNASSFSPVTKGTTRNSDYNSIYVNFNATMPVSAPWNNFTTSPTVGKVITDIKDEKGVSTGISVMLEDAWQGSNNGGVVTGNNSGVLPDSVMQTYYYEGTTATRRVLISGLSANKKYNLAFLSSFNRAGSFITNFTVNGQTVGLEAGSNASKMAKFNGLVANSSGQIEFSVAKASTSAYAVLNAMVIQAYDPGTLLTPSNLVATGTGRTKITLTWTDNSEETGFEIWRATSAGGSYSLIATTGANVTTYTDNGLQDNSTYYYKVRAITSNSTSSFSNVGSGKTFAYMVQVNFNFDNPAATPWNNTNSLPEQFAVFPNLMNDLGNPSGLDMTITEDFSGVNPDGMNTGNNSGVVPDNVMRSSWYNGPGVTSQLRIDGLSQVNEYNFVFFNSRNGGGDRTTIYTIGNQSVSLNASYNINNTVQISHVRPDENGSVYINIALGPNATFAYINGLIIQGYSSDSTANVTQSMNAIVKNQTGNTATASAVSIARTDASVTETSLSAYPNPFHNEVTLRADLSADVPMLSVKLTDISGRVISLQQFKDLHKGVWQQRIDLNRQEIGSGLYFLNISGLPGNKTRVIKLVKLK